MDTTSSRPSVAAHSAVPPSVVPASRSGCSDPRLHSRMSNATYSQFNTFSRKVHAPNPSFQPPGDYHGDCGLLNSSNQLSYDNYGYPSQYPSYCIGFAPPTEEGPAYEMYSTGTGLGRQSPETQLEEYGSSTHSAYSSPPSDYSQKHTQRMQTHV